MCRLTKGIKEMSNEVNRLHHLDSMKQLERQLGHANEKLEKAQSELVNQQGKTEYYEGLAGSRDVAAKESAKEVWSERSFISKRTFCRSH